jgi:hypothetical protein
MRRVFKLGDMFPRDGYWLVNVETALCSGEGAVTEVDNHEKVFGRISAFVG